jgi:uncharacterized protein (TIGR04141 family)
MPNKRAISIRMLKPNVADPEKALKDGHHLQEIALADTPRYKRLFAGQAYLNTPKWLSFFGVADRNAMRDLLGAAPAAILFVRVAREGGDNLPSQWLAVCFGMGFQALRVEVLENSAGLRIALNRIGRRGYAPARGRHPANPLAEQPKWRHLRFRC